MPTTPRLLAVSDRAGSVPTPAWGAWCAALAAAGVDAVQIREPRLDDRALLEVALEARRAFAPPRLLFVSRRFDVALAAGADGVQLPAAGLPVAAVRAAVGRRLIVGRSTHALAEIAAARAQGADFVLFGPVFDTPSKRGRIDPRGLEALAAASAIGIPVVAVGGIDATNVAEVLAAGAAGVAAIRAFADAGSAAELAAAAEASR